MDEPAPNPYEPPKAVVADVGPAVDAAPIPMLANIGVGLLWVHFTLDIIGSALQVPQVLGLLRQYGPGVAWGAMAAVAVLTLLVAWVIYLISRRRHWARVLYLVVFLIGMPFFLMAIGETFAESFATALGASLKTILQAIALVLLFLPSSNAWFRSRPVRE